MFRQKRGSVLVITLGILTIMAIMGSSFAVLMRTEYEATQNYMLAQRAKLIASDGIVASGKSLQDMLTYSYYSSLYNDDPNIPEYLKLWCYGVDKTTGKYSKDIVTNEYVTFGGDSILDNMAPVSLPYPFINTSNNKPFIDMNGDGEYKEEDNDELLEEFDLMSSDNRIFYDEIEERTLFSGFPADGRFLGNVDVIAGQSFLGGNRYKLKILETNSQLSMNYLSSTLYDFLVSDDPQDKDCPGSQFKYMLFFLGQAIQKSLETKIKDDPNIDSFDNPFDKDVVDKLWELRQSYGESTEVQQFSSKTQIRAVVEEFHPGYWKYVRDFITISAWPGYDSVYAKYNPNTIVPGINTPDKYALKLGVYDDSNPQRDSKVGRMTSINHVQTRVQPPIDCNTATLPVLYSAIAFISGDARFWYFSPDETGGNDEDQALYAGEPEDAFVLQAELPRAKRIWAATETSIASGKNPSEDDVEDKNYMYKSWGSIADVERQVKQYDQFDFEYGQATGDSLFPRNYQVLQYLNISPFRAVWDVEDINNSDNYALNFAKTVEALRPFTGWADFDKRVIQDIIIDNKGVSNVLGNSMRICEIFDSYWHPWNKRGPGGDPECDIDDDYLEQWYYEAVADLVRANFNPTPKITKWNPDATYYQKIDRSDLVYWTVPFTFINPGIFEVTSVGEIVGQVFDPESGDYIPKPVVQKQYQSIIKVADIVRHHSQKDFVTGFPNENRAFLPQIDDYSVVRLYAHENPDPEYRRFSRVTTYPAPINEDVLKSRIKDHHRPNREDAPPTTGVDRWESTYYTGNYSATGKLGGQELLYGYTSASESVPVGYVTVRPQDTGPFDFEMRVDSNSGNSYMGRPNNITTCNFSTPYSNGAAALELATDNSEDRGVGEWLNFWMPFNETFNTISKNPGSAVYGSINPNGHSFQSARIGSQDNNGRASFDCVESTLGLIWNASGYTFRTYDFGSTSPEYKKDFPNYLEYPSGIGFTTSVIENDLYQTSNAIESDDIIDIMPRQDISDDIKDMEYEDSDEYAAYQRNGSEGTHRKNQWVRQKNTNFPYYKGTVEFWFKSDVDQWDMTAKNYVSDNDTIYGGFVSANVLVQADPECGIQGCQTFILREMGNAFRVTRIYFIDAIKGNLWDDNMFDHWVADPNEGGGAGSGEGHAISDYIYRRSDTVPDLYGLDDQDDTKHFQDLDVEDLGFIFTRFDSWFKLEDIKNDFKWRPHEWYHLAFSFRSDATVTNNPDLAINFFINGVYVDDGQVNYPTTKIGGDTSRWNTGTILIGETFSDANKVGANVPQKYGAIVNEVFSEDRHGARLVIGAIKRNQARDDAIKAWNEYAQSTTNWENEELTKEMFYFADGPFVAPCNGTMDAVRITGRYLENADTDILGGTRIQAFARYNTSPGETYPDRLGSYENGFLNTWDRDVRIASINWNEYRPKWDSAISEEIMYDDSAYCDLSFWAYDKETLEDQNYDKNSAYRSYGFISAKSNKYKDPFIAKTGNAPNGSTIGIIDSGVAFPKDPMNIIGEDNEKFIIPAGGCFIYEVAFYKGGLSAANAASIFDELTVTLLTPIERFSFEEISE